jgi:hypothetical protein
VSVNDKKKITSTTSISDSSKNDKVYIEIRKAFGSLNKALLENIINHYSEEYILEKISYTKKYAKKENSGFYPIPYFISALKHDYKFKEESQSKNTEKKPLDKQIEWQNKLDFLRADLNHWEKSFKWIEDKNDETQIKNIKNIIAGCQEKIKEHLNRSIQEKAI